jgi:hypothetical protein
MPLSIADNLMDIDRIISIVRYLKEDGVIANAVGNGGLTNASTPPGRLDGYDKVMGLTRRTTIIGKGKYPGARKRWMQNKPPQ